MLKLLFIFVLAAAFADVLGLPECVSRSGGMVDTNNDGNTVREVKIGCKYDAVRTQKCGDFKVTLTPGLLLTRYQNKTPVYVIEKVTIGINHTTMGKLYARASYGTSKKDEPVVERGQEDGVPYETFFDSSTQANDGTVTLPEKTNTFEISYKLSNGRDDLASSLRFKCNAADFTENEPNSQLCSWEKEHNAKYRGAEILYHIFTSNVKQTDCVCKKIVKVIQNNCYKPDKGKDNRGKATEYCAPLVYDDTFLSCCQKHGIIPRIVFRACTEVVCRGKSYLRPCDYLRDVFNTCHNFTSDVHPGLISKMKAKCVDTEPGGEKAWPHGENMTEPIKV